MSSMRLEFVGNLLDAKEREEKADVGGPKEDSRRSQWELELQMHRAPHDMVTRVPPCKLGDISLGL